jgi:hypothetical protein
VVWAKGLFYQTQCVSLTRTFTLTFTFRSCCGSSVVSVLLRFVPPFRPCCVSSPRFGRAAFSKRFGLVAFRPGVSVLLRFVPAVAFRPGVSALLRFVRAFRSCCVSSRRVGVSSQRFGLVAFRPGVSVLLRFVPALSVLSRFVLALRSFCLVAFRRPCVSALLRFVPAFRSGCVFSSRRFGLVVFRPGVFGLVAFCPVVSVLLRFVPAFRPCCVSSRRFGLVAFRLFVLVAFCRWFTC